MTEFDLTTAIKAIRGSGSFFTSGSVPFQFLGMRLPNGEELAFPLSLSQARTIESLGEIAPYGKGEDTVTNTAVRHCHQIDAESMQWSDSGWKTFLEKLAADVARELGVPGKVRVVPYKLLLYGKGGHFLPHRDTEKVDGMFGSLLISLPSEHIGGELLVRHGGQEKSVMFGKGKWREKIRYAAFYADCEHEVRPVLSGYRLCLACHLVKERSKHSLEAPNVSSHAAPLMDPLEKLRSERPEELSALLLEHTYTEKNFSVNALKGDDRSRSQALFHAARECGFNAHLGLVSLYQMGELEGDHDESMGEVYEESLTIGLWRTPTNREADLGYYTIGKKCLIGDDSFGEGEPDESYAEGFTGNAGCTMEYWYRRAAVVIWPKESDDKIRVSHGYSGAAKSFLDIALKREQEAGTETSFLSLGRALVEVGLKHLPDPNHESLGRRYYDSNYEVMMPVLKGIALSRSENLLQMIPEKICSRIAITGDLAFMDAMLDAFGSELVLKAVIADIDENGSDSSSRKTYLYLLDATLRRLPDEQTTAEVLAGSLPLVLSEELNDQLERLRASRSERFYFGGKGDLSRAQKIRLILTASFLIKKSADRKVIREMLWANGRINHLRHILIPALLEKEFLPLLNKPDSIYDSLLEDTIVAFREEVASPLEPYSDWSRPLPDPEDEVSLGGWGCPQDIAEFIEELKLKLLDPDIEEFVFRKRMEIRSALENYINHNQLDLTMRTDKKGSPHTLICTKNDRSYHHQAKQRKKDEKVLKQLMQLLRD